MPSSYTADLPTDILIDTGVLYYNNADGVFSEAGLAKSATPEQFKTTRTARYRIAGVNYTKAPTDALTFTAAHNVTASKFGIVLVQINAAGTISTKVPASPQAYNSAALALAALPAVDASNIALGYLALANDAGTWVANTDDLTNGSDLTTAAFTDSDASMTKFGGTRNGLTFNKNIEMRSVPYDGASGETAGLHRKTDGVPTITGTVLLFASPDRLPSVEPGSTTANVGTAPNATMTVTPMAFRTMLAVTDYRRWECLWKRGNGGTFKVIFPLGLATIDSLSAQDNNEGESPITVRAVNDPDDIDGNDEVPTPYFYEITGPDIGA